MHVTVWTIGKVMRLPCCSIRPGNTSCCLIKDESFGWLFSMFQSSFVLQKSCTIVEKAKTWAVQAVRCYASVHNAFAVLRPGKQRQNQCTVRCNCTKCSVHKYAVPIAVNVHSTLAKHLFLYVVNVSCFVFVLLLVVFVCCHSSIIE